MIASNAQETTATALTIELDLPDQLVEDARNAGLLSFVATETMLREQLRKRHADELSELANSLSAVDLPPTSGEEAEAKIDPMLSSAAVHAVLHINTGESAPLFGGRPRQLLYLGRVDTLELSTGDVLPAKLLERGTEVLGQITTV